MPYHGAIVLVILGMGAILSIHLATPLRRLRRVVERFGEGDLAVRVGLTRCDEIGELSGSFDAMAGRIETLLNAERRLLQDVSHELRSPLARLDVAVELALTSDDPGLSLGRIKRDIRRHSTLVDEPLQLTRAEGDPAARVGGRRARRPAAGHRRGLPAGGASQGAPAGPARRGSGMGSRRMGAAAASR